MEDDLRRDKTLSTRIAIEIFKYVPVLSLRNLLTVGRLSLQRIIYDVSRKINVNHLMTLPLLTDLLEQYNIRYTKNGLKG